ncbi:MAG TPA: folate family ECF transporter S component [Tissierellaceae bacterium]|nr:folate family ECF transporter S component [Tissierellaceae bacterium]
MGKKKINTRTMVQAGFLVAISIVLTRFLVFMPTNTLRIGFGDLPLMLSGFLFGPVVGGITGIAADLIGLVINPLGPPHPGFTISSMLWGVISGLFMMIFKRNKDKNPYSKFNVVIVVTMCTIIISLGLNTYWLSRLYGKGFLVMFPSRLISAIVNIPIQSIIIFNLLKYLKNIAGVQNG